MPYSVAGRRSDTQKTLCIGNRFRENLLFFFFCYRNIDEYSSSSKCDSLIQRNKDQKIKNASEKHNDGDEKEMQREKERGKMEVTEEE